MLYLQVLLGGEGSISSNENWFSVDIAVCIIVELQHGFSVSNYLSSLPDIVSPRNLMNTRYVFLPLAVIEVFPEAEAVVF